MGPAGGEPGGPAGTGLSEGKPASLRRGCGQAGQCPLLLRFINLASYSDWLTSGPWDVHPVRRCPVRTLSGGLPGMFCVVFALALVGDAGLGVRVTSLSGFGGTATLGP